MAFTCSVLNSYNHLFGNLLTVCQCYERYSSPDNFLRTVCQERNSYMACLDCRSGRRPNINHRSVPVMIGSYIDVRIRGLAEVRRNAHLWGAVILLGAPRTYPNYSAFQPLALHIRETNADRYLALYTYIDDHGLALVYTRDGQVRYDYRGEYGRTDTHWNELLARSDPDKLAPTHHERTRMFAAMLRESYRRTDLGNRRVISSPHVMHRYVLKRLGRLVVPISAIPVTAADGGPGNGSGGGGGTEDDGDGEPPPKVRKKQSHANCMCRDFELGRVYSGLGKRATATEAENGRSGRYNQAYDHPMHDGRSSKTAHLLGTVVRDSNAAVRNSNALMFPADAAYFFCPLTTKDLKSAGEQNVLCDMVISSEATPTAPVLHYMGTLDTGAGSVLVLNDTPTRYRRVWTFADLLALKRRFPFVTTRLYRGYVVFYTCDSMPIKYSAEHGCFFGVCETVQANIRYPELDLFSVTAKELPPWSLTRTPPSKLTVSINNIKGGVATLSSELHGQLMRNSLGVTCYMDPPPDYRARLIALAELSGPGSASTEWFVHWYDRLNRTFCLTTTTDTGAHRRQQPAPTGTPPELALAAVMQLYAGQPTLVESQRPRVGAHTRRFHGENRPLVQQYRAMIGDARNYGGDASGGVWNMRLYAAFGNPHGDCVEDGVVVDAGTVARMEPVHYNACITVDFTFRAARHHQESTRFVTVTTAANGDDRDSLIGYLVTEHEPFIKHSKHTRVDRYRVGKHNYYLVHFLPKSTNMYDDVQARYQINNTALTVIITGRKVVRVGVGSKVANAFGQKNIISAVRDLRHHRGVTRDGRVVHAQIIYSQMSMVGRVTSGQLYTMLTSEDLAIARDGTFMAPVDLVLHNLHPFSNAKCTEIKNDTLTNVNGFDSQGLSVTCLRLRKENTTPRIVRVLGMLGYTVQLQGAREADQLTRAEVAANRARLMRAAMREAAARREPPPGGWNITSPRADPDDGGETFVWNETTEPTKAAIEGGNDGEDDDDADDDDDNDAGDDDDENEDEDDDANGDDYGGGTGTGTDDDDEMDDDDLVNFA